MVRNYKKLSELERTIQQKDLELAKYKQLVANITGLIQINTGKGNLADYLATDQVIRCRGEELKQQKENVVDEAVRRNPDLQQGGATSHVDELKQRQAEGTLKPSEIKKARSKERQAADQALDAYLKDEIGKPDEEKEGEKGDKEYDRLKKKDGIATGGKIPGECKNCGEPFEDKAVRGYHPECWEAIQAREAIKEKK